MRLVLLRLRFGYDDVAIHNYKVATEREEEMLAAASAEQQPREK
jgi:hypothetical protein